VLAVVAGCDWKLPISTKALGTVSSPSKPSATIKATSSTVTLHLQCQQGSRLASGLLLQSDLNSVKRVRVASCPQCSLQCSSHLQALTFKHTWQAYMHAETGQKHDRHAHHTTFKDSVQMGWRASALTCKDCVEIIKGTGSIQPHIGQDHHAVCLGLLLCLFNCHPVCGLQSVLTKHLQTLVGDKGAF